MDNALDKALRGSEPLIFDGGMGTMLQASGVSGYSCPEELNLTHPDLIASIHASYVAAGARVVETNTFGASSRKLTHAGMGGRVGEVVGAAVALARRGAGGKALVAGSIGPLGEFLEPVGTIGANEARLIFAETARHFREAGADFLLIETMADIKEVRAACLAARDAGLPFAVTMTFDEDGRTVLGTPPEAAVAVAEALGASLTGVNCSLGPEYLLPVVRRILAVARRPVLVQPNAGMPVLRDGRTVFPAAPDEFASGMRLFREMGVRALGGCCGTTPDHIKAMAAAVRDARPATLAPAVGCRLAGRSSFVLVGPGQPVAIIGERVNPTGRKAMAAELRQGTTTMVRREILDQTAAGAHLLDLNAGAPGLDEGAVLASLVGLHQRIVRVPVCVDSTRPEALEAALMEIEGRPLLNSVNASAKSLETILPIAARTGAAIIGLAMDEKGIPHDADGRLRLAEAILRAAADHGIDPGDILIDCLAVTVGAEQRQVAETLEALRRLRSSLGAGSVLGVSNVSHGMPAREDLNAAFLAMAVQAGLDAAIVNPHAARVMESLRAAEALSGRDAGAQSYLAFHRDRPATAAPSAATPSTATPSPAGAPEDLVVRFLLEGDGAGLTAWIGEQLAAGAEALDLGQGRVIPGLERIGELFERKTVFLPEVMGAAEAAREAFALLREHYPPRTEENQPTVVLATVEGDIHDLGKNILKGLLENHGFRVVDLGTNVPPRVIAERAAGEDVKMVGLSALMTTTLPALEETLRLVRERRPGLPVVVGGAVLTSEYADSIGASGYAPDAAQGVKLVRRLLGG